MKNKGTQIVLDGNNKLVLAKNGGHMCVLAMNELEKWDKE